jgi:predicted nucleic acid-binding protein
MALVTDVSSLLGLILDDEDASYAEAVVDDVARLGAVIPRLFWYELRNALVVSERRGRLAPETTTAFLSALGDLPFEVEGPPPDPAVVDIARNYDLSVYDASYLELASRRGLPLATLDRKLRAKAEQVGVTLFIPA